jgi:hypothetical protein
MVFMKAHRLKQCNSPVSLGKQPKRSGYDYAEHFSGDVIEECMVMGFRHYKTRHKNPDFSLRGYILFFIIFKIIRAQPAVFVFIKAI